ncbi:MAG: DUF998 domain-containing protein [Candidatus Hodarchaeota archaeon]
MTKIDKFIEKLNNIIPASLFGLLSITSGILGDIIALLMYPEYNFMEMAVSALCLGPGGLFFNLGNIFSGAFALIFVNYFRSTFIKKENNKNLINGANISANIACISFIILGIFCGSNIVIQYLHGIAAIISYIFGLCYITLFNILMIRDSNYSEYLGYFGFFVSSIFALLIVLFFLHLFPVLRFIMEILPLIEWISTVAVILWYFFVPIYMIHKKI